MKRDPPPSVRAADRRRQAVARERVAAHLGGLLDGLDAETRIETCRAGIRALAVAAEQAAGSGRASGVLCGALVQVAPAYRTEKSAALAAEGLFSRQEGDA